MVKSSALQTYETVLAGVTDVCADPWFAARLAEHRAGDDAAWRRISESCLGRVFAIAKKHWRSDSPVTLLDAVQEGNAALADSISRYAGDSADDFLQKLTIDVERQIVLCLQWPNE